MEMELNDYLQAHFAKRTAHGYRLMIEQYCNTIKNFKQARYKDVLKYLESQRSQGKKSSTLLGHLAAIKAYYDWLTKTGKRKDHPCKHLQLKDKIDHHVNVQDLFTSTELQLLLQQPPRKTRPPAIELRDKVILSLLIYQALTTKSITTLELNDVDLQQATIYIKAATTLNARMLELHPRQIMLISDYLNKERPALDKRKSIKLILTRRYQDERGCSVHDVVKIYKSLYPGRTLTPLAIRQSVITNLLKAGKDIRAVQVFAGHKSPKNTEYYQQTGLEELTDAVMKFHPLK